MFGTIKDAFEKYVLMDHRISELEERIKKLENSLSNIPKKTSKFDCKSCDTGKYRATNQARFFHGMKVGSIWKCDNCGHIPGEMQSQSLEKD